MKNRTIAWSQLSAVLLLALLPLGTELRPGRLAQGGAAAWLCPLLAGGGGGARRATTSEMKMRTRVGG